MLLRSNINVAKGLGERYNFSNEIIWPLFHRGQLHEYDIPSVRLDFGNDGMHVINPISK